MFASDRFKFETPNVIDLGDAPPSHPPRLTTGPEPMMMDDIRLKATRLLSESDESPSNSFVTRNYKVSSFDDDSDDDDGRASQLPSVEDARMYAITVLSASTERNHSPILIRQSMGPSSSYKSLPLSFHRTVTLDSPSKRFVRQRRCFRVAICIFVVAVALIVILIAVVSSRSSSSLSSSETPQTTRFHDTLIFLGQDISSGEALFTEGTPQYKAADWIANRDQLQYAIPSKAGADRHLFIQRYVLAVLYYSLNGEQWRNGVNFLTPTDECAWSDTTITDEQKGVTCSESLNVQGINIDNNNLKGSLPEELRQLTALQFISLRENYISGSIPSSLYELSLVDYVDLRSNELVGTLPNWIGQWQLLRVLGLSDNHFTGAIPSGLSTLGQLTTLALSTNDLQGNVQAVTNMTNLEYLYLDGNQFTGRLDKGILDKLQKLSELSLADNQFEAYQFPASFLAFPELRLIDLSWNSIYGPLPKNIPINSVLEYLTLSENHINGTIPTTIANLVSLRQLDVSHNELTGSIPYRLNSLTNLQYLYLDQNKFKSSPMPQLLSSMTQLRELSLADTNLSGAIPSWIKALNLVEFLDLRSNEMEGSIPSSLWAMTNLQYLLLSTNFLHGTLPTEVGLTNLQVLALQENALVGSATAFCNNAIPTLTYDCNKVTCDCCTLGCCLQKGSCYDGVPWVQNLGLLEHNYTLSTFGF